MEKPSRPAVTMDPQVLSGTPCLAGKRIPVGMIAEIVWQEGVAAAQEMWDLSRHEVLVACWYAGAFGAVWLWAPFEEGAQDTDLERRFREDPVGQEWLERWREWAHKAHGALWTGYGENVEDPPTRAVSEPPTTS